MAEDMTSQESISRKNRDRAVLLEGRNPDHRVVPPVGAAVGLPPGTADRPRAHAKTHAKLEDARKGTGRRHADDKPLQDAELRIGLDDADHPQDGRRGHVAVRVERHHEIVGVSPSLEKVADVACLVARVGRSPPIGQGEAACPTVAPARQTPPPRRTGCRAGWYRSRHRRGSNRRIRRHRCRPSWHRGCEPPGRATRFARTSGWPSMRRSPTAIPPWRPAARRTCSDRQ